jgi:DNA-binding transcriptional regulator YbjK
MISIRIQLHEAEGVVEVVVAMDGLAAGLTTEQLAHMLHRYPMVALTAAREALTQRLEVELQQLREVQPCD